MADEKVSVIIPTVQKNLLVLKKLVNLLEVDNAVSEILIINNIDKPMDEFNSFKKVKLCNQKENLYVNGSWNLGIELIQNDIFLIINDDILPVKNYCSLILKTGIFDKKMTGLVGINPENINQNNRLTTKDIEIPDAQDKSTELLTLNKYKATGDWGSAFFGRKKNYYKIPNELKIIFGDNYLLYNNIQNAKINYQVTGLPFNHIHSQSSASPEFGNVIQQDIKNSVKYIP